MASKRSWPLSLSRPKHAILAGSNFPGGGIIYFGWSGDSKYGIFLLVLHPVFVLFSPPLLRWCPDPDPYFSCPGLDRPLDRYGVSVVDGPPVPSPPETNPIPLPPERPLDPPPLDFTGTVAPGLVSFPTVTDNGEKWCPQLREYPLPNPRPRPLPKIDTNRENTQKAPHKYGPQYDSPRGGEVHTPRGTILRNNCFMILLYDMFPLYLCLSPNTATPTPRGDRIFLPILYLPPNLKPPSQGKTCYSPDKKGLSYWGF